MMGWITDGEKCKIRFLIDLSGLYIMLFTGNSEEKVISSFGDTKYKIQLKSNSGNKYQFNGTMSSDRIKVDKAGTDTMINLLLTYDDFKMIITYTNDLFNYSDTYTCDVETGNFNFVSWND